MAHLLENVIVFNQNSHNADIHALLLLVFI